MKESDVRRPWRAVGVLSEACPSFISTDEKRGYAWKRIDLCRDHLKDGRRGLLSLYILLSLPAVS